MIAAEDELRKLQATAQFRRISPGVEFEYFSDQSKAVIASNIDGMIENGSNVFDVLINIKNEETAHPQHLAVSHPPHNLAPTKRTFQL